MEAVANINTMYWHLPQLGYNKLEDDIVAKYESYEYEGYRFVFKYDEEFPELLHIWVRHLKTVEDAVRAINDMKPIQTSWDSIGFGWKKTK